MSSVKGAELVSDEKDEWLLCDEDFDGSGVGGIGICSDAVLFDERSADSVSESVSIGSALRIASG